jgi:hypothetical protein
MAALIAKQTQAHAAKASKSASWQANPQKFAVCDDIIAPVPGDFEAASPSGNQAW